MLQKFNLKSLALFGLMMAAGSSSAESTFSQTNTNQIVAQSRPQVVATSTVICDLTKQIAGKIRLTLNA